MSKIKLVFLREFLTRIKSKGFIISTLLAPLGLAILMGITIFTTTSSMKSQERRTIALVDYTGKMASAIKLPPNFDLKPATTSVDMLRKQVLDKSIDGFVVLPDSLLEGKGAADYYSRGGGGISFQVQLQDALDKAVQEQRLNAKGVSEEVKNILKTETKLRMQEVTLEGNQADATSFLTGVAYAMALLIYIMMLIYGSVVMQSVMEEKSSRILEIMASSVKPYDLMMGKVLGMGVLGVVQMTVWAVLSIAAITALGSVAAMFLNPATLNLPDAASQQQMLDAVGFVIPDLKISLLFYFLLYFIGGYLLYSSFFVAVGSAVESPNDAQQLLLPITMLIIIPMMFIHQIILNPDGTLSALLSIVPFFSPILMPARIAVTDVPLWQIGLSLLLLIGTFMGAIWVSARIYRIGILMYGKKPSLRDLLKWIRTA